ncbi:uncharacterized protein LOC128883992 isoform X2 [Hylaeus volcanicus]|uniref:uncharacterized protein LOC128883992 isoform X2 n=1 Tax=Hylaeus volcanicus TaxID=313075 RepID=UPI0023B835B9|nr:uncharacterized protein LOC128883992 isoform X2 [Hylaeus volcanicus]
MKMKREEGSLQPINLCNMEQQVNHEETKFFFGFVRLNYGIFGIGCTDIFFGVLMSLSYFRKTEVPLVIAGAIRILSGFWCFTGLYTKNKTMMNLFLLLILFNNCLVLSVCIGFAIIVTSSLTIVCDLPTVPLKFGEQPPSCPFTHRKGRSFS